MRRFLDPPEIAGPADRYHHGLVIPNPTEIIRLSGQLGARPDGSVPDDFAEQALQAWSNVSAILAAAGAEVGDITKVTSYIVGAENIETYCAIHRRWTEGFEPPWTLVLVAGLGADRYRVEIDVEAMR
jgi:enamine deaminase RidA (YjgF/YER057c/UK114 family)